ncbi:hypothetical protein AnigIFM49718_000842 [Aspergillus niger]|nr:hypothetical protein AnigIFM49718_000842 [Aspergillus niger]GLA21746.1 hypothetical protein AnigIFM62618_000972 [Aspergillus niger]
MVTPRLLLFHPNFTRVAQSYELPSGWAIRFSFSSGSSSHAGVHTSRKQYLKAHQQHYRPTVKPSLYSRWRLKNVSPNQHDELALSRNGSAHCSEKSNTSPEQFQSQDTQRATTDTSSSTPFHHQAVTDSRLANLLVNWEQQEAHAMNDRLEDIPVSADCPRRTRNNKPQLPPYQKQGAFDDAIHMPNSPAYLNPPRLATPNKKLPGLTPINEYYFDTYSLVCDISKGGFTNGQSVTIMRAVHNILQKNIKAAKQCLTSKSDDENETYLFAAACSELQSSFQTFRRSSIQRQHASRIQLQHESDILSQRLDQEIAGMKDSIRAMFGDHSLTTREQQRKIDTLIQKLNHEINMSMNNDGRSEIEGLRWILTSRAALTVATCALMIIVPLKHYSVRAQDSEMNIRED